MSTTSTTMLAPDGASSSIIAPANTDLSPNASLVARFMRTVWDEANPALLDQFLSADFVDHAYTPKDKSGHATMVRMFAAAFSPATHEIQQCTEQDDLLVIRLRVRGLHSGPFRDIAATGHAIDVTQYRTFRLAAGCIVEHWALFDSASLLRQLQPHITPVGACAVR